jgi:hypothetical protein
MSYKVLFVKKRKKNEKHFLTWKKVSYKVLFLKKRNWKEDLLEFFFFLCGFGDWYQDCFLFLPFIYNSILKKINKKL